MPNKFIINPRTQDESDRIILKAQIKNAIADLNQALGIFNDKPQFDGMSTAAKFELIRRTMIILIRGILFLVKNANE